VLVGTLNGRAQSLGPANIAGVLLLIANGMVGRRLTQSQPEPSAATLPDPIASTA